MTATQLINEVAGAELQPVINQTQRETNSMLAGCNVHWIFRASYTNNETGRHGIRHLIVQLLTSTGAVFGPKASRDAIRAKALTTRQIIALVRQVNGFDKYPDKTISDVLCNVLPNEVASIQLTNWEDRNRPCKRPRKVWYVKSE